jgi:hypothetical protein
MKVPHFLARYALLISLVVLCMVIGFLNPVFLSLDNLTNILLQSAVNLIIALGMTFVIIVGGIDLSVGSLVALTGMALGLLLVHGVAVPVAILGVVLLGALCGGINGIVITRWRVPAFIVTLGTMSAARGVALMLTSGRSVSGFSSGFLWLGNGVVAGIPFPAFVALLLAALCALSLRGTICVDIWFARAAIRVGSLHFERNVLRSRGRVSYEPHRSCVADCGNIVRTRCDRCGRYRRSLTIRRLRNGIRIGAWSTFDRRPQKRIEHSQCLILCSASFDRRNYYRGSSC